VLWRRVKVEVEVILQKWARVHGFGSNATNWQRWVYSLFARSTRFASFHLSVSESTSWAFSQHVLS